MSVYRLRADTVQQDELHVYGSSRLGIIKPDRLLNLASQYGDTTGTISLLGTWRGKVFRRGQKLFELTNHLGNVLVTITDRKQQVPRQDTLIKYYEPDVVSATDYAPFGMQLVGRTFRANGNYRYGFGDQEMSNEIKGIGNSYTAEFWEYDPRLGRRWNVDPVDKEYESPYAAFGNNPIWNVDPNGADTAKYLSNSQLSAAVKIAYNVINNDVKAKKYNASNDKSAALNEAMLAYWKTHQSKYNFNAAAEFQYVTNQYYKGFLEVATGSSSAWARLGERINNPNISDATNVQQAAITIQAYNGRTTQIINMGANAALGIAAGGVDINAGPGPRGPQINSANQQKIVNIRIRNSVPKNINAGQQGKYIVGHNNYVEGKSILTTDAQTLLNEFHAGKATILRQPNANRVIVNFNKPIGTYVNPETGVSTTTTKGTINFGKNGAHIVPSNPN